MLRVIPGASAKLMTSNLRVMRRTGYQPVYSIVLEIDGMAFRPTFLSIDPGLVKLKS